MALIDFILNIVGVLLWLNWRARRFDPLVEATPATLIATLRRAEPKRLKGWPYLAGLALLLVARAMAYEQVGAAVGWTPKLDLGVIVVPFRNDLWRSLGLYSVLSYARIMVVGYVWTTILWLLNRNAKELDPVTKLLRMHLGRTSRWPWPLQAALPLAWIVALWAGVHPALFHLGLTAPIGSGWHLPAQGLLIAIGAYASVKFVLLSVLLAYLIIMYVYLGSSPLWDFVVGTARALLAPLRWLPLKLGKLDLAPLVCAVLLLLLLHVLPNYLFTNISWPR